MSIFDLEVLLAINEWQRGGDHKQKIRRGAKLKAVCETLPDRFRICGDICYRQEAHEKDRVWQLIADEKLPETIASWTTDLNLAKTFKRGVPPAGLQGVIFALAPTPSQVVVNLKALYADSAFLTACERHRDTITGFSLGIGKYGSSQAEVVLEVEDLGPDALLSYGGYSSPMEGLAASYYGGDPTAEQLADFRALMDKAQLQPGAWWLSREGAERVFARVRPRLPALKAIRAAEAKL